MPGIPVFRHEVPSLIHVTVATSTRQSPVISEFTPRKQQMTSISSEIPGAGTIYDMFAEATRSAGRSNDLAIAAGQILTQRVALGMKGALNPWQADHAEFARMVPEKVEAFSAAGMVMLKQSNQANQQLARVVSDEVMTTARATLGMIGCTSPAAFLEAQGKFARAWFDRATSNCIAIGMMTLNAQDAVIAPIRQTVAVNVERLGQ
jgi:Phasin protein